ncbi:MAG: hypothetical protein GQ565_12940 [Candidatus Aegiribacteria sp.]|nr:hypothetical protein [Candidatus Aegiribacteria sp.]
MKSAIIIIVVLAIAAMAQTETSSLRVEEVFSVETAEELEASLTDGYPMPWLEEILNDESIPQEDRYWLDCRVRAVIAQDLHLFFDEEGNPVHIETDWIAPGEDYWRENFMVNPAGEPFLYDSPDRPTNVFSEPGFLVNRFGEEIGQLAMTHRGIRLSRDASIGVTLSGRYPLPGCPIRVLTESCFACLLFPDGTFKEIPIGYSEGNFFAISNDGNTIAVTAYVSEESPERNEGGGLLSILNRNGEVIHKYFMTNRPFESPVVSANGRFVACQQYPFPVPAVYLIDGQTGELLHQFGDDIMGHSFFFTPNEKYLCIGGLQRPLVFDCETLQEIWTVDVPEDVDDFMGTNCDNEAQSIAMMVYHRSWAPTRPISGTTIHSIENKSIWTNSITRGNIQMSPGGNFSFSQSYSVNRGISRLNGSNCLPMVINHLAGGE